MDFALCLSANGDIIMPIIILFLYVSLMIAVAYYCRKRSRTLNDFMFAGRGLGGWMSAFSYGTTYFSAVIFIGYAGKFGWNFGLASVWIGIFNAIIGTYLAWKVLAKRTKNITRTLNARTLPEFFEKRYDSKNIRLVSSIVIFVFLIPYSASVYQGLGYLFESIFGISFIWCILIMATVTALYLFFGGYMATSLTDFLQGCIMLVGVGIMMIVLLGDIDWGNGLKKLTENGLGLFASTQSSNGKIIDSAAFNVVILVLLTSFGIWALPQSIHKFYAIKDDAAIKKGAIISSIFSLIVGGGAYFVGSFVTLLVMKEEIPLTASGSLNFDTLVPIMLTKYLPVGLLGLIMVLVLSASMSTLASLSLVGSSSLSVDLYKTYINKNAPDQKVKMILRGLCVIFILLSALLAITNFEAIVTFMSLSWGTLAGCFIGPYVLGLYSKKITKAGAWASIIGGLLLTFTMIIIFGISESPAGASMGAILKKGIGRSPLIGVSAMAFSMIITAVVSAFTKPPKAEIIQCVGVPYIEKTEENYN